MRLFERLSSCGLSISGRIVRTYSASPARCRRCAVPEQFVRGVLLLGRVVPDLLALGRRGIWLAELILALEVEVVEFLGGEIGLQVQACGQLAPEDAGACGGVDGVA